MLDLSNTNHKLKEAMMIDFLSQYSNAFFSILTIWILAVIMPGPDMFLIIRSTIQQGKYQAFGSVAGIVGGTLVWLIVGFFLINFLNKTAFFDYIKLFGGAYLIYMASIIFLSLSKKTPKDFNHLVVQKSIYLNFLSGLLTNLSNPKPPIFVSIILSKLPLNTPIGIDCLLLFLMLLIPSIWFYLVVEFFSIKKFFNIFLRYAKMIDFIAGVIFGLFGCSLIYEAISKIF